MSIDCTHATCRNSFECKIRVTDTIEISEMQSEVEIFIDRHGLDVVLSTIREICYAKANHIAVEWQDVGLAKLWLAKGIRVNQAAQGVRL